MKQAKDLKIGDEVGVLGWHHEGGIWSDDPMFYGLEMEKISSILKYDLRPETTGLIREIRTTGGKIFIEVSKNQSVIVKDKYGEEKWILYIDKLDILKKKIELKKRECEEHKQSLDKFTKELEELTNTFENDLHNPC